MQTVPSNNFHLLSALLAPSSLILLSHCIATFLDTSQEQWGPWTHTLYCKDDPAYCVFANADFQGPNGGVSLIKEQSTP